MLRDKEPVAHRWPPKRVPLPAGDTVGRFWWWRYMVFLFLFGVDTPSSVYKRSATHFGASLQEDTAMWSKGSQTK